MAQLAGMRLRDRWEDWKRDALHEREPAHVSVWETGRR